MSYLNALQAMAASPGSTSGPAGANNPIMQHTGQSYPGNSPSGGLSTIAQTMGQPQPGGQQMPMRGGYPYMYGGTQNNMGSVQMGGGQNMSSLIQALGGNMSNPNPAQYSNKPYQQQIGAVNTGAVPQMPTAPQNAVTQNNAQNPTQTNSQVGTTSAPVGIPAINPATGVPTGANSNTVTPSNGQTGSNGAAASAPIYANASGNAAETAANYQAAQGNATSKGVDYQSDPNNANYQVAYDPGKGYQFSDPYTGQSSYNANNTGWSPTEQAAQQTFQSAYGTPGGNIGSIPASLLAALSGSSTSNAPAATAPATRNAATPARTNLSNMVY